MRRRGSACALGLALGVLLGAAGVRAEGPGEPAVDRAALSPADVRGLLTDVRALVGLEDVPAAAAPGEGRPGQAGTPTGPGRSLVSRSQRTQGAGRDLGGQARSFSAEVRDVNRALRDLGAEVRQTEIRVDLSGDVLFDFDEADVRPEAERVLGQLASVIRARRTGGVQIFGHTDAKGSDAYNADLSLRRAESVRRWLYEGGGVPWHVMHTHGLGEQRPVAPNTLPDGSDNPAGRQRNRRVEIVIQTVQPAG